LPSAWPLVRAHPLYPGHPHEAALKLLAQWLARDHGVSLVPLDEAIRVKAQRGVVLASR